VSLKNVRKELIEFMLSRSQHTVLAEDKRDGAIVDEAIIAVEPAAGSCSGGGLREGEGC